MTVDEALRLGAGMIGRREAAILLSEAMGCTTTNLYVYSERVLEICVENQYQNGLARRRANEPLQYIIGHWPFMELDLLVDKRALIPREDTEVLTKAALSYINKKQWNKPPRVLDLCTGGGCVGIALAYHANARVTAVDINPDALSLATENAIGTCVMERIRFVESDLFTKVNGAFDVIVSNPPYIPTGEIDGLDASVAAFEPFSALDGGADGMMFYRRIIPESIKFLPRGGALLLEIGDSAGVTALLAAAGYQGITVLRDIAGLERVAYGVLTYER